MRSDPDVEGMSEIILQAKMMKKAANEAGVSVETMALLLISEQLIDISSMESSLEAIAARLRGDI